MTPKKIPNRNKSGPKQQGTTLAPLSFDEAVDRLLSVPKAKNKPEPPAKKKGRGKK